MSDSQTLTMAAALNTALRDAMREDPAVVIFGEDVGVLGGVFRVTDGLAAEFGNDRCFDTPIAEAAIVGTAVGMAMYGFRPVIEMQFDAFSYPAMEQITSHVAKMRNRTRGKVDLPMVIRIPYGGGIGSVEHHSDSSEVYYAHTPGLKVVTPGTVEDAYHLLRAAIRSRDPVVFFEPKHLYWSKSNARLQPLLSEDLGGARVLREGATASLITYGATVPAALETAEVAEAEEGWDLAVLDLRTLSPLDTDTIGKSVRRTGHAIVIHEAPMFAGLGAEIAASIQEDCFHYLEAPVLRVAGFDIPYPPAKLEHYYLPSVDRILDTVWRSLTPAS
jgi:pyruvate dehydrogenase E1 component beta subunit